MALKIDPARCIELATWAREVAQVRDEDVVAGADAEARARTRENMTAIADQLDASAHAAERWLSALDNTVLDPSAATTSDVDPAPRRFRTTLEGRPQVHWICMECGRFWGSHSGDLCPDREPPPHPEANPTRSFADALRSPALGELVKASLDAQAERSERGLRWILGDAKYEETRDRLGRSPGGASALLPAEPVARDFLPPLETPPGPPLSTEELRALQSPATVVQPRSVPNDGPAIVDLVIADLRERAQHGEAKYGVRLQPHNGRVALVDLYQELLDAAQYLRQEIEERRLTAERAR